MSNSDNLQVITDGASAEDAAAWFFENSIDGFAISREGRILSVNSAWCNICRCSRTEAVGRTALDLVHPEDLPIYRESERVLAAHGVVEMENRLLTHDGGWVWVRTSVKRGQDGYAMIVIHDLTAARALASESEASAKVNDLLRTAAGVITWRFDPDTQQFVSDSDFASAGDEPIQAGQNIPADMVAAVFHPHDGEAYLVALTASTKTGEAGEAWYRRQKPNGGWGRFRSTWRGLKLGPTGRWTLIGISQDMTELLEARDSAILGELAARDAVEVKSRFLANMSHEIRTPLNAVLGILHLLKPDAVSGETQNLIGKALASGELLTAMLNSILDLSAIEQGEIRLTPEAVDPSELLTGVVDILRPQIEAKGLYLHVEPHPPSRSVRLDPTRVRQVLFNLVGNAGKFTQHGGVRVRMVESGDGAEHRLRVEVEDTGAGISEAGQKALFGRFHQDDSSSTRRFGGMGLGLAISRHLAELMGGTVGVSSTLGRGSTFWVEVAAPIVSDGANEPNDGESLLSGRHVLVVDDNANNRLIAVRLLETLGATVSTAEDGAAAVEMVTRIHYDLIFMDIQMPVLDGVQATRLIRAMGAPAGATPILAMTANVMSDQVERYQAAGMDGVVAKPISPATLVAALVNLAAARNGIGVDAGRA